MDWAAAARFLGALIDLIFLEKQLDILELTKDEAYALADKQVLLAEEIVVLHCQLLDKVANYYGIANSAPVYSQQYGCAMDVANTDVIREANRSMNAQLDTTDMYSIGLRQDFVESAMAAVVFSSSGQWALAYRNEDELHYLTDFRKYKHMVDSIHVGSLYTAHNTMARLAQNTLNLAESTSQLIESHLEGLVTGVTDWVAGPSKDKGSSQTIRQNTLSDPNGFFDQNLSSEQRGQIGRRTDLPDVSNNVTSLRTIPGSTTNSENTFVFEGE